MKKIIAVLVLGFMLGGCGGSGQISITYHEMDWETMQALKPGAERNGFAEWDWVSNPQVCDIYLLPKSEYRNVAKYHEVLGHEVRHCFEGDFHN